MEIQGLITAQNTHQQHGVSCRTDLPVAAAANSPGDEWEGEGEDNDDDNNEDNGSRRKSSRRLTENGSDLERQRPGTAEVSQEGEEGGTQAGRNSSQELYVLLNVLGGSAKEVKRSLLLSKSASWGLDKDSNAFTGAHMCSAARVHDLCSGPDVACQLGATHSKQVMESSLDSGDNGGGGGAPANSSNQCPAQQCDTFPNTNPKMSRSHQAHRADLITQTSGSGHLGGLLGEPSNSTVAGTGSEQSFSGTIMVNNQSIVVTFENGVLTLAAPAEGQCLREDSGSVGGGLDNLKGQLGVKENQDIVLINYDGTTRSLGKNGASGVEDQRAAFCGGDSGLTLEEDCSFSDPGSMMDSCSSGKYDGAFCSLAEGDMVDPTSKELLTCDGDDLQLSKLAVLMAKKDVSVTYHCPQPECSRTFESKHRLKIHLLSHTEEQRPFRCPVEGCGWAFTTSYKLKRHLQSHDKLRPFACEWENCGRRFTTVYNLKAHAKAHDQENTFVCEVCSERFRSATRLSNHRRTHFEPERPHKCEFPGCEKSFITFSALFSHNRTHFRDMGQFTCSYPGCDKRYDKACRLKIHLRSHTGERPFVCDSDGCGWSFTSMSKLLRHKRKHEDDRRFTCQEEGCGKSFTRAEHLKGHIITHLGTKPFECPMAGCSAKFSARSSLYIHSKKHQHEGASLRTRCFIAGCSKHFSSRSSLKSHMLKHHNLSADLLSQLEISTSLTPSSELTSVVPTGGDMDLGSLFAVSSGGPVGAGTSSSSSLGMDMSLVSSGILTIDTATVGATLGASGATLTQTVDPLILAGGTEVPGFEAGGSGVLPQAALSLDDVPTVNPEALGSLAALALRAPGGPDHLHAPLTPSSSLASVPGPEPFSSANKPEQGSADLQGQQEGSKAVTEFVFSGHSGSFSAQKEPELVPACSYLESGGSARTDYRAIQLAKKRKLKGATGSAGSPSIDHRKSKSKLSGGRFGEGAATGGLTLRDPVTGTQYVQIQLLQDDPAGDGDLAFQLSTQSSSSHSQLTVDLPVNILQEPPVTTEDDATSDASQFTGSTINLQDLE